MIKSNVTLSQAIAQFDRSPTNPVAEGYRSQRAEILKRFPRDKWPEMRLDDYALGQPAVEDTYCRWLEYKSHWMGSIRGGSAKKLIIYKRKEREGWYFPKAFSNEREAWDRLRGEFSQGQTRILGVSIVLALAIASLFTNFFSSQSVPGTLPQSHLPSGPNAWCTVEPPPYSVRSSCGINGRSNSRGSTSS